MRILLVEPGYKNKYPPLGLMKISSYHKFKGDEVFFTKGEDVSLRQQKWDRIYITTLFTFHWNKTIKTIEFYTKNMEDRSKIFVGGILATLLFKELEQEKSIKGITILRGLLDQPGILGDDNIIIDRITPDYEIVDSNTNEYLKYEYKVQNAYITSTTKGCIRRCRFCAVKTLEPHYLDYIDIKDQILEVDNLYGKKRDLMLMDNNILASQSLSAIIDDLIELGYSKGNKTYLSPKGKYLTRHIDFNQGTDARLLSAKVIHQLSKLEIKPLRIAFDHADKKNVELYKDAQRLAAKYQFPVLSNYVLYNFEDNPYELYYRLKINIELNEEFSKQNFKTKIWSFPMKYMPLSGAHCKDRKYVGKNWNAKLLRGVQCVLNATHGVVGTNREFFEHAFGKDFEEFLMILYMPESYIFYRKINSDNGNISEFKRLYYQLNDLEMENFTDLINSNENINMHIQIENPSIKKLYKMFFK